MFLLGANVLMKKSLFKIQWKHFVFFYEQWAEYILFASLLVLVCIIFAIMSCFYTYIDPSKIEAQFSNTEYEEKEEKKKRSLEMTRKDSDVHSKVNRRASDEVHSPQTKL